MSYKPLTKQQANEMARPPLIVDGQYQCELMEYHHTNKYNNVLKDKNNEDMTRIKLKIWDHEGRERFIFTNLFWGENNKMSYRTRHFAESFGMSELYDSGKMYDNFRECLNTCGHCEIYTQNARDKNDGSGEMWPAKNDIRDFIVRDTKTETSKNNDQFNDEIPF